ncbi:MAG: histidine kinase dimerization/phospho-acceptor domain-containing protein [Gammaproteobacteria bacterium]
MSTPDHQPVGAVTQALVASADSMTAPDVHLLRDLAAGFAHELNQPLAAIAAYADGACTLLRRDPDNGLHALSIIQAISGQAMRAGEVVQQLRAVAGPFPPRGVPIDPNQLVRTTLPLLQSLAESRSVHLLVELRTPIAAVVADPIRLQALLILLFGNALDALDSLPPARRRVTISTDDGGSTVELAATEPRGSLFQLQLPRVPA